MSARFADAGGADVARLITEAPLCWIVPHGDPAAAILMPVVLESDASGEPRSLLGHSPRKAPVYDALRGGGEATFLFLGANGYVSPAHAGTDDWAPTWNFVSAKTTGAVTLDEALTRPSVEAIVARMEGAQGWTIERLGARYDQLAARIIGFRAAIGRLTPRFKLGQDERPEVLANIRAAHAGTPLGEWMDRLAGR
jgi:transcriptional regulator